MFFKLFYVIILVYSLVNLVELSDTGDECLPWKNDHIYEEDKYTLVYNFYSFNDLENSCSNQTYPSNSTVLQFLPNTPNTLVANRAFRVNHLVKSLVFKKYLEACIVLNFRGVQVSFGKIGKLSYLKTSDYLAATKLIFAFSQLEFYLENQQQPLNTYQCENILANQTNDFLFSKFIYIEFINVKYPHSICPYVFRNYFLKALSFSSISNSLLNRNRLNFLDVKRESDAPVYSLRACTFNIIYDVLDARIMNRILFERIQILVITGIVDALVDEEIFKSFLMLSHVYFSIYNLRDFFHQTNNKWIKYMNDDVKVDLEKQTEIEKRILNGEFMTLRFDSNKRLSSFNQIYSYPDEDFCLFKHYPHVNLVIPELVNSFECTCTIKFLVKYNHIWLKYTKMVSK